MFQVEIIQSIVSRLPKKSLDRKVEKIKMHSSLWKPICEPSISIRAVPREIKIRSRISPVGPSPPSFPEPERKCAKESEGFPPVILG